MTRKRDENARSALPVLTVKEGNLVHMYFGVENAGIYRPGDTVSVPAHDQTGDSTQAVPAKIVCIRNVEYVVGCADGHERIVSHDDIVKYEPEAKFQIGQTVAVFSDIDDKEVVTIGQIVDVHYDYIGDGYKYTVSTYSTKGPYNVYVVERQLELYVSPRG